MFLRRWWKLTWQPCQFRFKLRKKHFHFPQKVFCSTGNLKAVWPSCRTFYAQKSHFCKSFQKIVFLKKFLWTIKSHFWQACRNHFCQTLYYVIAQGPELIRQVWIFHKTLVFSICSSWHKDVSSAKIAESFSAKILQDFCSKFENQNKKLFFQRKSPKMFFWTRRLRLSTLPEIIQPNWNR